VNLHFTRSGWDDYLHWSRTDPAVQRRLNDLLEDIRRHPFTGIGKPEPLRGELSDWWSRRITAEHRLIYRVVGKKGEDQRVQVAQAKHHY